jgi:hypothetical protein
MEMRQISASRIAVRQVGTTSTSEDSNAVGVCINLNQPSPSVTRVNGNLSPVVYGTQWFNAHPIWGMMRRCNLDNNGDVTVYYGGSSFTTDGSNGQVMVEIPKFYYKSFSPASKEYYILISPTQLPGYKIHPAFVSDGGIKDKIYVGAFEAAAYDVTDAATEVNTITITNGATSSGNLTVTLDGNYAFTVAVAEGDSVENVVDKVVAAGNKTDYQGVTWTVSKVDASNVRYTAGSTGLKTTVLMPAACGVTRTITKTTTGTGGYVKNDATGIDTTATTGDKLSSVAGVKPISGWKNTLPLATMRTLAQNRGSGWGLWNYNQLAAIQLLYLVEYASFHSQSTIGAGVTAVTDATAGNTYNNAINTGYTAGVGTGGSDLGNTTGECASVTHYSTTEAAKPLSYRGIENLFGNINAWVDGINFKADRNPWIADHDFAVDTFAHPYTDTGLTMHTADAYIGNILFGGVLDYGFLSAAGGGSATTYLCDHQYQATGNAVLAHGGHWPLGTLGGLFTNYTGYASTISSRNFGARISFVPPR